MNLDDKKYQDFALCHEMLETVEVMRNFNPAKLTAVAEAITKRKSLLLTGEGSSRIFPAKNAIYQLHKKSGDVSVITEGCLQALEYNLKDHSVIGLSNSGKTSELLSLYRKLTEENHRSLFSVTAYAGSPVTSLSSAYVLECGAEKAVAATKSVVEQALALQIIISYVNGDFSPLTVAYRNSLALVAGLVEEVLNEGLSDEIISSLCSATKIYFSGRNNGVAEELALKTNEITRKKSMFLEGTFLLHGIEEVMEPGELIILIDPWESEEPKIKKVLSEGVGIQVIAISSRQTLFPTILIPATEGFEGYLQLAAGWNLLVETGLSLDINIDKGLRARKIGNEG